MEIDVKALEVKNNLAEHRFEVQLGNEIGELVYRKEGSVYFLDHTGVPVEYRGQGIANHLVREALEEIKLENAKIVPECPFVKTFLRRYPDYQSLVVPTPHH
jgi:predicted GNAT family acetyltransferase